MEEGQVSIYVCDAGFGLGLPIAKALVEGQQGTIEIDSKLGCGSTIRVRLPSILV